MVNWEDTILGLTPEASVLGDDPAGTSSVRNGASRCR
jgi:hypothetical protein